MARSVALLRWYLVMNGLEELRLFFKSLTSVLRINMSERLMVQVLKTTDTMSMTKTSANVILCLLVFIDIG